MLHLFEVGALAAHVGAGDDGEVALGRGRDVVGHDDGAHVVQDRVAPLPDDQGFTEPVVSLLIQIFSPSSKLFFENKFWIRIRKHGENSKKRRTQVARNLAAEKPPPATV